MAAVQVFASSHWSQVPNAMAEHCAQVPPGPSKKKPVWQVAAVQRLSSLQAVQVPPLIWMEPGLHSGGGEVVGSLVVVEEVASSSSPQPAYCCCHRRQQLLR